MPAVVRGGIVETASHIDPTWIGVDAVDFFSKVTGRPVAVLNDADAAGIAEVRFGAGRGTAGVVAVITLGTGIGSALFVDGTLVPNSELGHLPLYDGVAENWAAESVREREGLSWEEYARRLQAYLDVVQRVLWPQLIIIGGGISNIADKFLPLIGLRTPIVPAQLRNHAGIIGAALFVPDAAASSRRLQSNSTGRIPTTECSDRPTRRGDQHPGPVTVAPNPHRPSRRKRGYSIAPRRRRRHARHARQDPHRADHRGGEAA